MSKESFIPEKLVENAKTILNVGQKQWAETVSVYKTHGKQFLKDGKKIANDSKAFYKDLWQLQVQSIEEIKKALKDQPKAKGRQGATTGAKKASQPKAKPAAPKAVETESEPVAAEA